VITTEILNKYLVILGHEGVQASKKSQESEETSFPSEILWCSTQPQHWEMRARFLGSASALPYGADDVLTHMGGPRPLWPLLGCLSVLLDTEASPVAQLWSFGVETMIPALTVLICFGKM
jgi:hypothetical protein